MGEDVLCSQNSESSFFFHLSSECTREGFVFTEMSRNEIPSVRRHCAQLQKIAPLFFNERADVEMFYSSFCHARDKARIVNDRLPSFAAAVTASERPSSFSFDELDRTKTYCAIASGECWSFSHMGSV